LDNYSDERTVKIAGDNIPVLTDPQTGQFKIENGAVTFSPEDISGEYDLMTVDGTGPVDRSTQSQVYLQYMQQAMQIPGFAEEYRLPSIMRFIMKNAGLNIIDRFKVRSVSDEELLQLIKEDKLNGKTGTGIASQPSPGGALPNQGDAGVPALQAPIPTGGV